MCSGSRSPSISAVVVSHNEGDNLRLTVQNLLATLPGDAELIVVDDASEDASAEFLDHRYPTVNVVRPPARLGVARARNFGGREASGRVLVFLDAHVETPVGWTDALAAALDDPNVGAAGPAVAVIGNPVAKGFGFTWRDQSLSVEWLQPRQPAGPYPVPMLGGFCVALRNEMFKGCGGFDDGLVGWGSEDAELCFRLWTFGHECVVVPEIAVGHLFRERLPHLKQPDAIVHNYLRVAATHFSPGALTRVVESLRGRPQFAPALARLLAGDVCTRRRQVRERRVVDDAWFFERFGIESLVTRGG